MQIFSKTNQRSIIIAQENESNNNLQHNNKNKLCNNVIDIKDMIVRFIGELKRVK